MVVLEEDDLVPIRTQTGLKEYPDDVHCPTGFVLQMQGVGKE